MNKIIPMNNVPAMKALKTAVKNESPILRTPAGNVNRADVNNRLQALTDVFVRKQNPRGLDMSIDIHNRLDRTDEMNERQWTWLTHNIIRHGLAPLSFVPEAQPEPALDDVVGEIAIRIGDIMDLVDYLTQRLAKAEGVTA